MPDMLLTPPDIAQYHLPSQEAAHDAAYRSLAHQLGAAEKIWIVREQFHPHEIFWDLDIVRQGAQGDWVRQRYRYDGQSETIYYLGESALSVAEFRAARKSLPRFDVVAWKR